MQIQIRTDHNTDGGVRVTRWMEDQITESFGRYSDRVTRIEAHLSDTNSAKQGHDDKRCMIEARPSGHQPIAVVSHAETMPQAFENAIAKLDAALEHLFGKLQSHQSRARVADGVAEIAELVPGL